MRKPLLPSEKRARGTYRQDRDALKFELLEPDTLPIMPDWLTEAGKDIWLDDIGRAELATERDSTLFASYCNLAGACSLAWRSGDVPPVSALSEMRRLAEMLGLAGRRSRMTRKAKHNPFERNGRRKLLESAAQ